MLVVAAGSQRVATGDVLAHSGEAERVFRSWPVQCASRWLEEDPGVKSLSLTRKLHHDGIDSARMRSTAFCCRILECESAVGADC